MSAPAENQGSARSFVAAEIPESLRRDLSAFAAEAVHAVAGFKAVAPSQLHLTLRFLGDVPRGQWVELAESLRRALAGLPALDLAIGGVGVFPGPARPRVLWVGVGDGAGLELLASRVAAATAAAAGADDKPFRAHVTVARRRDAARPLGLGDFLSAHGGRVFGRFRLGEVVLKESELRPGGAIHRTVARVALGEPA